MSACLVNVPLGVFVLIALVHPSDIVKGLIIVLVQLVSLKPSGSGSCVFSLGSSMARIIASNRRAALSFVSG